MTTSDDNNKKGLSRRTMFGAAAVAAAAIPAFSAARAQPAGRGEGGPINSTSLGGGLPPQGGQGKIRVLFISAYHAFDRENLFRWRHTMLGQTEGCFHDERLRVSPFALLRA